MLGLVFWQKKIKTLRRVPKNNITARWKKPKKINFAYAIKIMRPKDSWAVEAYVPFWS